MITAFTPVAAPRWWRPDRRLRGGAHGFAWTRRRDDGILSGALLTAANDRGWRIAFLIGAIAAPVLLWLLSGQQAAFASDIPAWAVLVSGLAVGLAAGILVANGLRLAAFRRKQAQA